jgi:hypothetical protein
MTRATVVDTGMWRRLGLAFFVMAAGLAASFVGLGWDFYGHEIQEVSADLESVFAAPHLLIFGGIGITALGFLIADLALRRQGWYPLRMVTA